MEAENAELRQVLMLIAAAFPTKLILGATGERVQKTIKRVMKGELIIENRGSIAQ